MQMKWSPFFTINVFTPVVYLCKYEADFTLQPTTCLCFGSYGFSLASQSDTSSSGCLEGGFCVCFHLCFYFFLLMKCLNYCLALCARLATD